MCIKGVVQTILGSGRRRRQTSVRRPTARARCAILTARMADHRRYFDEIELGEEYESPGRTVTEADIVMFAGLSGDYNVLHTDDGVMKSTIFVERIANVMV